MAIRRTTTDSPLRRRLTLAWACLALAAPALWGAPVDYTRDLKPVFSEHCYRCHGASQQKGGLRMDTAAVAAKGGDHGALFTPGQGAKSLLLQVLEGSHEEVARMPYKKPALTEAQIALVRAWIDEGAAAPAGEEPQKTVHWAFVAPVRPAAPALTNRVYRAAARNPIDAFILARLEREQIRPSPEAAHETLLRRLSLDLTGLPPTPGELDTFLRDTSGVAYERQVGQLLGSPHFGERWGRWWLDMARYADSNGYSVDAPRSIWKYRDWVIAALNRDQPFDEFVTDQIAGDLRPEPTLAQQIATGFHRNTQINQEGGIDPEQFRIESVMDRVNTTGAVFLGLTVGCAQCHDHKFDPVTQSEYYRLFAFFNSTVDEGHGQSSPGGQLEIPGEFESSETRDKEKQEALTELDRYLNTKGSAVTAWEKELSEEDRGKLPAAAREALALPWSERNVAQKRAVYGAFKPDDADFKSRDGKLKKLEKPVPVTTLVMKEMPEPRKTHLLTKGDFTRPAAEVTPGLPAWLAPPVTNAPLSRMDLARWLVDPANPLTARVVVNRIWQQYFGRGLVETDNDFGTQGSPPSHPELLDWLACELMQPTVPDTTVVAGRLNTAPARPWSLKHIHRLILTSGTYRQSSKARAELAGVDANNRLLARQNRVRLDAEVVRDVCLAASGLLNPSIGGPSVYPPQPEGVMALGQSHRAWTVSQSPDKYRRGLYTFYWRATPHPSLSVFDAPDAFSACTRRLRSNTPLQSLTLLNDAAHYEFAQALARRLLREGPRGNGARIDYAFRLCLGRLPAREERSRLLKLLESEMAVEEEPAKTAAEAAPPGAPAKPNLSSEVGRGLAAWTTVARVLLNLDETITRE